jgi:cell division ATPase FtsA
MHVADEIKDAGWERQLSSGVVLTGGGALLHGMTEIAEQVFDAPVRIGYPERDRFGGLVEDIQSPAWTALRVSHCLPSRSSSRDRTGVSRRGSTGKLTHFVSRFRNRFGSIF